MANLPEPDWITLLENAKRAERAFGTELSAVKTALIDAFHDGKIRTRGRCHSFFGHDVLRDLASYTWDRADVVWQNNEFTIPDDRLGRERHTFLNVVVHRGDSEEWINGTMKEESEPVAPQAHDVQPSTPAKADQAQTDDERTAAPSSQQDPAPQQGTPEAERDAPRSNVTPPLAPVNAETTDIEAEYAKRVNDHRVKTGRRPTFKADNEWRKSKGLKRDALRDLRQKNRTDEEKMGGHPLRS